MLLNELLKQNDDKKIVENPNIIEFSSKTVRFRDSLYQLRNVTGFEVGKIPKNKLPLLWIIGLFAVGLAFLIAVVGIIPIGIAIWLIYSHVNQVQKYGFILSLNSNAAKSGGVELIKVLTNNPFVSVPLETVKGWIEAEPV
jgi:hypothetical protein